MSDNTPNIDAVKGYLLTLQDTICDALCAEEGLVGFLEDNWTHREGHGGGRTRVMAKGDVFDKAGVNFSHVTGDSLPPSATQARPELTDCEFEATGVSLVIHPANPFVPTTHMNIRVFCATTPAGKKIWWFGGGYDLTPYYPAMEDCVHWHEVAQSACAPFGDDIYDKYKKCCDDYFYLPHRGETRGIGGLFFDEVNQWDFDTCFSFLRSVGDSFLLAYLPIVQERKSTPFGQSEKDFQLYRRGRYVEFNLLYDRGTHFGIQSGGRAESILMSLPDVVHWNYNWAPEAGTPEAKLYSGYLQPRDWLSINPSNEK